MGGDGGSDERFEGLDTHGSEVGFGVVCRRRGIMGIRDNVKQDLDQVAHARSAGRVVGDGRVQGVGEGVADLEGDVVRGVGDEDARFRVPVGFGHFAGRVAE